MNTVRLLSFGIHRGSQIFLNDDIKTSDTSTMYCFPNSSATDVKLNSTFSSPNLITESLKFVIKISTLIKN